MYIYVFMILCIIQIFLLFLSGMTDSTMSGYDCHTEYAEDVTVSKKQKVSWGQALKSVWTHDVFKMG